MGGPAPFANSLRSSVASGSVPQRSSAQQTSYVAPTAGVGVMAAVGSMMSNPNYVNDGMAYGLDACPPTAILQV